MPSCVRARFHVATPCCSACVVLVLPRSSRSRDCVLDLFTVSNITNDSRSLSTSPLPRCTSISLDWTYQPSYPLSQSSQITEQRLVLNMCLQTNESIQEAWHALRVCAPPPHGHCVRARLSLRARRLTEQISLPRCLAARAGRRGRRGRRPRAAPSALRCEPPAACLPPRRGLCRACGRGWRRW